MWGTVLTLLVAWVAVCIGLLGIFWLIDWGDRRVARRSEHPAGDRETTRQPGMAEFMVRSPQGVGESGSDARAEFRASAARAGNSERQFGVHPGHAPRGWNLAGSLT